MTSRRLPDVGPFTEIRVHGVGDHDFLSALGQPRIRQLNAWVQTAEVPPIPEHQLLIVNWSRSNRRNTGFLWYLAFPFTLVNVAGRMHGSAGDSARSGALLRGCVALMGLILTLTQLAWLVVLGETVVRYLPLGAAGGRMTAVIAALLLAGWLSYRWRAVISTQEEPRAAAARQAATHIALVLAAGVLLAWLRPAQLAYGGWPSVATPTTTGGLDQSFTVERLDAMALWIAVSTGVAFLLAAVLLSRFWAARPDARRERVPETVAGALLVAAVLLLHGVTALLRMVLDNILAYITGLFGGSSGGRGTSHAVLLAYDSTAEAGDSRLDLFPFLALIAVAAFALAAAIVLVLTPSLGLRRLWGTQLERAHWLHRLVGVAPALLPRILPLAWLLALTGMVAAIMLGEGRLGGPWLALAILALHLAGAAAILVLLLGQLATVRSVLGKTADIAGFWPIRDHPLAGVSYRDAVVAGIRSETERDDVGQVVLVAHSQGSVICAWLMAGPSRPKSPKLLLVSAGSPLASLYATFFPTYFDAELFRRVSDPARAPSWVNFWRDTDPIGTAVDGADNRQLADPRPDDPSATVRGHTDYWTEPELTAEIARMRKTFPDPANPPVG